MFHEHDFKMLHVEKVTCILLKNIASTWMSRDIVKLTYSAFYVSDKAQVSYMDNSISTAIKKTIQKVKKGQ